VSSWDVVVFVADDDDDDDDDDDEDASTVSVVLDALLLLLLLLLLLCGTSLSLDCVRKDNKDRTVRFTARRRLNSIETLLLVRNRADARRVVRVDGGSNEDDD